MEMTASMGPIMGPNSEVESDKVGEPIRPEDVPTGRSVREGATTEKQQVLEGLREFSGRFLARFRTGICFFGPAARPIAPINIY